MDIKEIEAIIEGLLFASGDALKAEKIAEILEMDKKDVRFILNKMADSFMESKRGVMIREINDGYQLCSLPGHKEYIERLFEIRSKQALSQAAFETLSIIAYNQPVTKAMIEQIRGVNSDSSVTRLLERNLVTYAGRVDGPGRAMLFATTDEFLRNFGFKNLKDLPPIEIEETSDANDEPEFSFGDEKDVSGEKSDNGDEENEFAQIGLDA